MVIKLYWKKIFFDTQTISKLMHVIFYVKLALIKRIPPKCVNNSSILMLRCTFKILYPLSFKWMKQISLCSGTIVFLTTEVMAHTINNHRAYTHSKDDVNVTLLPIFGNSVINGAKYRWQRRAQNKNQKPHKTWNTVGIIEYHPPERNQTKSLQEKGITIF